MNNRKKVEKSPIISKLNNTLLNDLRVNDETSSKIWKYFCSSENENITYQNVWDAAKAVLWGKYIPLNWYIMKKKALKSIT